MKKLDEKKLKEINGGNPLVLLGLGAVGYVSKSAFDHLDEIGRGFKKGYSGK
ncbi:bacteriocin [Mammaliicoccus stepanovicii]|uniref:Bacteriocin n=1 Tax=Mammaliicoccus stepanovicii TaxID=643214 RepID=A0A239YGI7_9STAP|nr:bacteriocin [Mammaliicoccus stepanovicii]PNZ71605.1 bacteriocin [Mammaliicoccus stepanovicii]GGI40721.1 hypothetical protein GCM10010896_09780 [Mammaliicoccus stepanovicii]SNV57820.1 Uncharacterised protein [Mammaliicoccus stepanovicii]